MLEIKKLITAIGEFVSVEIDEVDKIEYIKEREAFTIFMNSKKQYILEIKEIN